MPSLKEMINSAHSGTPLPVTEPHSQWLELPEEEQVYSERAIQFAVDYFSGKFKRKRTGRISASAVGGPCRRKMLLGFAGASKLGANLDSQVIMDAGTQGHFFWQMEGFSYPFSRPWLLDAEMFRHDEKLRVGGSIDGQIYDGSLLEVKTVAMGKYSRCVLKNDAPDFEHLIQVHVYFKLSGIDACSLVYVDRNTGAFHEFRVYPDDKIMAQTERILSQINRDIDVDELPAMLDDCELRRGYVYQQCEHRKSCPKSTKVSVVA